MKTSPPPPLILAFVSDLMFTIKIEDTAQRLNYRIQLIEREDTIAPPDEDIIGQQLAEHLSGQGAILMEKLTRWHPSLMIFDLSNKHIPWRKWISLIKSAPATRRIPVMCFGSHVDVDTLKSAKSAGADVVLARSRFVSDLPNLIQKHAFVLDNGEIETACQEKLSTLGEKGIQEFNRGEYFLSHETLEEAWNEDQSAGRELYRAILQIAVAYLQIERNNYRGAMKMFLRVRQWIDPLPELCRGVDIAQLRADSNQVHQVLVSLGPERIAEFDQALLCPIRYK